MILILRSVNPYPVVGCLAVQAAHSFVNPTQTHGKEWKLPCQSLEYTWRVLMCQFLTAVRWNCWCSISGQQQCPFFSLLCRTSNRVVRLVSPIYAVLYLRSFWRWYSITSFIVVRFTVKVNSWVTQQWLSVGSLSLWPVAVSVGFSAEPGEATV